ncbi:MCE family protein [Streptomyces jumonjinensis]|uniref:MCE family protein n=1 Tax=Streptomyces jumonjinensis TaxID=1945 RepID=A0A646KHV0_STRJU|nr:MCE family protein [Streptomyces jumonjinensis]MQT01803.1 MCE family protein [Streptomyces jumonjinensis]
MNLRRLTGIGAGLALLAVTGTSGVLALRDGPTTRITAYFSRATGVYEGSDLRILGVRAGTVDAVEPVGDRVRVTLLVDNGVTVPKNAHAVVVAPSIVADRYVQLTPAYTGGERIADGAVLPAERNALPLEVDQLYESITELSTALGPRGANADGALARLLGTGADNLKGNGRAIGDSIGQFGKAARTLDRSSGDLFATLAHLQSFTAMLKDNDSTVAKAERQLATVTGFLADDKENLSGAIRELGNALGLVKDFIADNRDGLKKNIEALEPLTRTLVDQRASLAEALEAAPLAAQNALAAYDPAHRTLNGRADINELSFGGVVARDGTGTPTALEEAGPARQKALPALPLPAVGTVYGTPRESGSGDGGAR